MSHEYRILPRGAAAIAAAVLVLGGGAIALWADSAFEHYAERITALQTASPAEAAATLARDLKIFALAQLGIVLVAAIAIARYGVRSLRSGAMPPPGSWIIAGQQVRVGPQAETAAWLAIVCAGLMTVLGCGIALMAWRLAATA